MKLTLNSAQLFIRTLNIASPTERGGDDRAVPVYSRTHSSTEHYTKTELPLAGSAEGSKQYSLRAYRAMTS